MIAAPLSGRCPWSLAQSCEVVWRLFELLPCAVEVDEFQCAELFDPADEEPHIVHLTSTPQGTDASQQPALQPIQQPVTASIPGVLQSDGLQPQQ